ncbi:putative integral membrane transport protein [Fulvimarina pelagi HTCC2506]|uniref:Putative integral membrane transport protein n=2 Tax=Fulvimarina pelagi TaxID=217511 RepID=Q0G1D5_9HYPH|nr:MFS transporter [Fulvimarina pelagi]EAU41146.1 putative integral membrane transport protein [Fulvimarina pelagi HTCC2506]BAT30840.1 putative integral membrane transport protein [Fulvimarina pelagi]
MTASIPAETRTGFVWTVALLSVSVTLFWAAIYYAFATMLPLWEAEEGWDRTTLTALFAASVLVSGVAAPRIGRLIDAGHGPVLIASGSAWGVLVLTLAPFAPSLTIFAVLWISLGLSMATTLYEPVFAMVTRAYDERARRVITIVTLVGALAGTLAFPLVHVLGEIGGWRLASWVLAGMLAGLAAPLHFFVARRLERLAVRRNNGRRASQMDASPKPGSASTSKSIDGRRNLILLTTAFALAGGSHGLIVNHILPIMASLRFSEETAVLAASVIGPMQLLARLTVLGTEERLPARFIAVTSFAALAVSALCLIGSAALPLLLLGFGLLQGYGYGSISIMRPVLLRESTGMAAFGERSGQMARAYIAAVALAPFTGSLLWQIGGYELALSVCVMACALASVLTSRLDRHPTRREPS